MAVVAAAEVGFVCTVVVVGTDSTQLLLLVQLMWQLRVLVLLVQLLFLVLVVQ